MSASPFLARSLALERRAQSERVDGAGPLERVRRGRSFRARHGRRRARVSLSVSSKFSLFLRACTGMNAMCVDVSRKIPLSSLQPERDTPTAPQAREPGRALRLRTEASGVRARPDKAPTERFNSNNRARPKRINERPAPTYSPFRHRECGRPVSAILVIIFSVERSIKIQFRFISNAQLSSNLFD